MGLGLGLGLGLWLGLEIGLGVRVRVRSSTCCGLRRPTGTLSSCATRDCVACDGAVIAVTCENVRCERPLCWGLERESEPLRSNPYPKRG